MGKLSLKNSVTFNTHTLSREMKEAKSNGMSKIVDKPVLKLRNDMRKEFIKQCDTKIALWIGCCRITIVYLSSSNPWIGQLKVISMKLLAYLVCLSE